MRPAVLTPPGRLPIAWSPTTVRAAATPASRRRSIGVEPAWDERPAKTTRWRSTPMVPATGAHAVFSDSSTGPCSM